MSIDGDTSTNDSFVLIATHQAKRADQCSTAPRAALKGIGVAQQLAQAIVRDGEGRDQVHHRARG